MSFLRGRTEYGDSIEDEWVIVWLLRELTKKFPSIWVKVTDTDGEFLLIEASGTIPAWLEPEVAENRVWIHDGQLKILKPANTARSSRRTEEKLTLQDAQQIMRGDNKRILHSTSIEEEAFYRLRNYPQQIKQNMHNAILTLPRKVAFLLLQKPAYISPAIEAFYLRDPIALKPLQKKDNEAALLFPPEDLVSLSIKFPRVGYAQIRSQDFTVPPVWTKNMPSRLDSKEYIYTESGMKVTSGFEMLLTDSQHQDKQPVREMKMLLEDLRTGDEDMPTNDDIDQRDKIEDDEKWLEISLDDLDTELAGKSQSRGTEKKRDFGDKAAQENLQRIVQQFESFLNDDKSGPDSGMFGNDSDDDLDDDDEEDDEEEDKDASFNEDDFTKMMQEMMGMPPEVMKEIMGGTIDALSKDRNGEVPAEVSERARAKVQEVDYSDEEDIMDMKQMEAELRASGALNLNPGKQGQASRSQKIHDYKDEEDHEIESEDEEDDFDAEFARNILQSFRSGGGASGPAANLFSMMSEQTGESSRTDTASTSQKRSK